MRLVSFYFCILISKFYNPNLWKTTFLHYLTLFLCQKFGGHIYVCLSLHFLFPSTDLLSVLLLKPKSLNYYKYIVILDMHRVILHTLCSYLFFPYRYENKFKYFHEKLCEIVMRPVNQCRENYLC